MVPSESSDEQQPDTIKSSVLVPDLLFQTQQLFTISELVPPASISDPTTIYNLCTSTLATMRLTHYLQYVH